MDPNVLFQDAGKQAGLQIWAVSNFKLVPVPPAEHGTFYSGDCYLILSTIKRLPSSAPTYHIHFWIGSESSIDEQGSVAIFAAQLDSHLGDQPVQHRQAQGAEDDEFRALFPRVTCRQGGQYSTGFTSAASHRDVGPAKLHRIKSPTKAFIQVLEIPANVSSLNSGDSFVLEVPAAGKLFVWHGTGANWREKTRAVDVANSMRASGQPGSSLKLTVVDDGDTSSADAVAFFAALGVSDPSSVTIASPLPDTIVGDSDAAPQPGGERSPLSAATRLFQVQGADVAPKELTGALSKRQLLSDGVFAVVASNSVWLWSGKESSVGSPFSLGTKVLAHVGLPSNSPVRSVKEGYEPTLFTTLFPDWARECFGQARATAPAAPSAAAAAVDADAVAAGMLGAAAGEAEQQKLAAALQRFGVDGSVQVWVARGSELQAIPAAEAGELFSSDSYVVDYTYSDGSGEERHVVYYWLGRLSSNNEQGTAALLATEKHHGYNGNSTLARVAQGQEPPHFVKVFSGLGGLVIHRGNRGEAAGANARLYQVKAEAALGGPYAAEVEPSGNSLNSGDCFLLLPGGSSTVFQWQGKLSSASEQAAAATTAARLAKDTVRSVVEVQEGVEDGSFWDALGGQVTYPSHHSSQAPWAPQPVLFIIRDTGGSKGVQVERCPSYSQDDLCAEDSAILDSGREVLVWYGPRSPAAERAHTLSVAKQYASQLEERYNGSAHPVQVAVSEVEGGAEPPFFTQHFPGWDARPRPSIVDVYAEKLRSLGL